MDMNEREYDVYAIVKEAYKAGGLRVLKTISEYISTLADKEPSHKYLLKGLSMGIGGQSIIEEIGNVAEKYASDLIKEVRKRSESQK